MNFYLFTVANNLFSSPALFCLILWLACAMMSILIVFFSKLFLKQMNHFLKSEKKYVFMNFLIISATITIPTTSLPLLYFLSFILVGLASSIIDFETQYLPDELSYLLFWLGLIISFNNPCLLNQYPNHVALSLLMPLFAIFSAMGGYCILWLINYFYCSVYKVEGIGQGDFKLLASISCWTGIASIPLILLMASAAASISYGCICKLKNKQFSLQHKIAFGPWLILGGWLAIIINSPQRDSLIFK